MSSSAWTLWLRVFTCWCLAHPAIGGVLAALLGLFFTSVSEAEARAYFAGAGRAPPANVKEDEPYYVGRAVTGGAPLQRSLCHQVAWRGSGVLADTGDNGEKLGFVIWQRSQVALAMDFMQQDNHLAARDTLGLLFVFLEQMPKHWTMGRWMLQSYWL